jgi:hypothetical protein
MLKQQKHWLFWSILVLFSIPLFLIAAGGKKEVKPEQTTDSTSTETVFTEVHVTPDGAYVIDSFGQEWEYDFSRDEFENGTSLKSGEADEDDKHPTSTIFGRRSRTNRVKVADKSEPDSDKFDIIIQPELDELFRQRELLEKETRRLSGLKLGKVIIEEDEKVKGPIFAVGEVIVRGMVVGDVISYKRITVTSTGTISGDATAPDIVKMRGGRIKGSRRETTLPEFPEFRIISQEESYVALIVNVSIFAGLMIFGLLGVAIAPKSIQRIKDCLTQSFVKSFILGLLFWVAFAPLFGLLCLTIIGIPVAIIGLPIATLLGILLGIIGLGQLIGFLLSKRFGIAGKSQLSNTIFGLFILDSVWLIMSLFFIAPTGTAQGFATLFLVISIIVWSVGVSAGVGAVILTRFGSRVYRKGVPFRQQAKTPPPPTPPPLARNNGI